MSSSILGTYENGNYIVTIYKDGTKIRKNKTGNFFPYFPESLDVTISTYCDNNCPMCYMGCSISGTHADLLNQKWVDTLHPYTELAINGNDLSHPQLVQFLEKLKCKNIIVNITVNQSHFEQKKDFIDYLYENELIYGLGVSLNNPTDKFIKSVKKYPNCVIHTINGILTEENIKKLSGNKLKLLILGYKTNGRGKNFLKRNIVNIVENQIYIKHNIPELLKGFKLISFDNLAIEQLGLRRFLTKEDWDKIYMGDEGQYTFYIDMVNKKFAKNSMSDDLYQITDNVNHMFNFIRNA